MNTHPTFGLVIEYVHDMEAATRFYTDVMGLHVQRRHPTFVQFDSFALASDERLTAGTEPELYWLVDDADAAFRDLSAAAEVTVQPTEYPFGKVFGVRNPNGRTCFLLELAKNRPSVAV